jgi:uncharacterized delta-60 repeat protein
LLPDGRIDTAFGDAGVAEIPPTLVLKALAERDPGGHSIVAGGTPDFGGRVMHVRDDGTMDPAFGDAGIASTQFASPGPHRWADSILLSNGGLAIAAADLVRTLPTGELDPSFGDAGVLALGFYAVGIARADAGVFCAGSSTLNQQMNVALVNDDASLNPGFGDAGIRELSAADIGKADATFANLRGVTFNGSQVLVAATATSSTTQTGAGPDSRGAIVALGAEGAIDPSFGDAGIHVVGDATAVRLLALFSDGRIGFAGLRDDPGRLIVGRLLPNGTRDPTFGTDVDSPGVQTLTAFARSSVGTLIVQPDGKMVAGGTAYMDVDGGLSSRFLVVRLNP